MSLLKELMPWELGEGVWAPFFEVWANEFTEICQQFRLLYPSYTQEQILALGLLEDFPFVETTAEEIRIPVSYPFESVQLVDSWLKSRQLVDGVWCIIEDHWVLPIENRKSLGVVLGPSTTSLDSVKESFWETYGFNMLYEDGENLGSFFFRRMLTYVKRGLGLTGAYAGVRFILWAL